MSLKSISNIITQKVSYLKIIIKINFSRSETSSNVISLFSQWCTRSEGIFFKEPSRLYRQEDSAGFMPALSILLVFISHSCSFQRWLWSYLSFLVSIRLKITIARYDDLCISALKLHHDRRSTTIFSYYQLFATKSAIYCLMKLWGEVAIRAFLVFIRNWITFLIWKESVWWKLLWKLERRSLLRRN